MEKKAKPYLYNLIFGVNRIIEHMARSDEESRRDVLEKANHFSIEINEVIERFIEEGKDREDEGRRIAACILGTVATLGSHIKTEKPDALKIMTEATKFIQHIFAECGIPIEEVTADEGREVV